MALLKAEVKVHQSSEEYARLKRKFLSEVNHATERVENGMIYCRKCYKPKLCDEPDRPFIVKCCCDCEVSAWERNRKPRANYTWLRKGDYNPFD